MPARKFAPTIVLLTIVLTLIILAALACGPATPSAQDNVPPAESRATPTPEAGAARDLSLLDGLLRARVAEYEAAQAAQGASRQATTPKMVGIHISAASSESRREILSFLAEHGVTSPRTTGNAQIFADVPASLLAVLATRTDINKIEADPLPYQNLGPDLSGLAVKYAAGLLPDEDTEPTFVRLVILIEGNDNYDAIRRFLDNGGAVMAFGDHEMEDAYKPIGMLVAYVPVKLFAELDEKPGVFDIRPEIYPVPERMRIPERYPSATPSSPSSGSSGEGRGATGQDNVPPAERGATPTPTPTPEAGAARDLSLLDGLLRARVAEYEAAQAAQGASRQATTPKMVGIHISAASSESRREILSFLAEHGVTSPRTTGNAQIFADVPASLLAVLATRTDINKIEADPLPYQNLGPDLSGLAVKYAAGLLPDEDTEPTFVRLVILIEGNDNYDAIRRFLDNGGAVMAFGDHEMEDAYKPIGMLVAYVPVKLFAELDEKPGVFDIRPEIYPVPERMRIPARYPSATPSSPPSGSSGEGQGATGAAAVPSATPTRTGGAVAHGAAAWHSDAGGASGQAEPTPAPDSGNATGQGSAPGQNAPTPTPPPPAQNNPSGLTAVVENGAVTLFWMPGTNPNYVNQAVKRREPGVQPAVWTDFELDASADTYTDTTVESGKSYIYRVKGLKSNDKGGESNRVVIAVP